MLYVRFLSSLSPPLDTFATVSKVYRPSQTPRPAMSSKGQKQVILRVKDESFPLYYYPASFWTPSVN